MQNIEIITGPCSVSEENISDLHNLASIKFGNKTAASGIRVVGLKSRTNFAKDSFLGIDGEVFIKNVDNFLNSRQLENYPSVEIAIEIHDKYNICIATEIMSPELQLPLFLRYYQNRKLFIWNPSVNQLGWTAYVMSMFAAKMNWTVALKNGKFLGSTIEDAKKDFVQTSLETTWAGLNSYCINNNVVFVQRGVDVPEKGEYRNLPIHEISKKVKMKTKKKIFFDPSHSLGPKLKNNIVDYTIECMKIKIDDSNYLYDGILLETGFSKTDTAQHISIDEFETLLSKLSAFRRFD